ncbi:uncharacterized protein LOC118803946 [Colossoma macropomum]|uniref:uncharacterized protein LOC118803946 n=1 Tax=Colossoma macropomum TaxID=42526 RepID=UPI0018653ED0|nr:uncharacterized protein LOC118803946 [Colossoma macropomum]
MVCVCVCRSVMQSCSSALCILILLIITFTTVSVSADPPVKVNLHDSATLPCSERCSGLVRWTVFTKPTDTLAECDQTSCRSVKEGYQMIHDQYLKGNLSLTITEADFTKRGWYTSDCDDKDLCDVRLQIEPLSTAVQIKSGDSLVLKLDISDPVEVIYNSTGTVGPSSGQICTVDRHSTWCKDEYTQRASLTSVFELRNVTPSDSGVYTVMDKRNEEVIHIYTVTVGSAGGRGDHPDLDTDIGAAVPVSVTVLTLSVLGVTLIVFVAVIVMSVVANKRQRREKRPSQDEG